MPLITCLPPAPNDFCNDIVANPDISGIGVRVAIYVQTLINMAVASWLNEHEKAFRDTSRNSYTLSGGLIVASIIAWQTNGLSLFDALVVSMLTTISTAFVSVNVPYIRTLGLSINMSSLLFTSFWCYWGLQIWADPWNFGLPAGQTNCTANQDTVFVVFATVSATNRGLRGFALFIFAIGAFPALGSLYYTFKWIFWYLRDGSEIAKDNAAYWFAKRIRRKKEKHITKFGGIVGLIYMIATTELIVARNPGVKQGLNQWSYGQIIALVMLGQQILDCFAYLGQWVNEKHRQLPQNRQSNNTSGSAGPSS